MKLQHGFSFIELMVTIAIVGIASALALVSLTSLLSSSSGDSYAKELTKGINFSRIQGISSGQTVTLCPIVSDVCSNDWTKDIYIFLDTANNRTLGLNQVLRIIEAAPAEDSLTYSSASLGISFYPDGSIGDNDSGVFTLQQNNVCDETTRAVEVNISGRARYIEYPDC